MGINLKGLKSYQKNLESRGGGGYFNQKEIGEETDIRILPPVPSLNGLYFIEQTVYWIGGKSYISPATLDMPCPIERYLEDIEEECSEDADLKKLWDKINSGKRSTFLFPVLVLDSTFDDQGNPVKVEVKGNKARIMQCGSQLIKAINKIGTSRHYQTGEEDGFLDRVKGYNILAMRTVTGKRTTDVEYSAQAWRNSWEIEEKWCKNVPDVVAITKAQIFPDDYYEALINNAIWGEDMPEKPDSIFKDELEAAKKEKSEDSENEKLSRPRRRAATKSEEKPEAPKSRKIRNSSPKAESSEEVEEKAEKPTRSRRTSTKKSDDNKEEKSEKPKGRNLLNDLNNM